jgi:uncharacterized protein
MKINSEMREKLNKIGRKYDLKFIILHGSYARGEEKRGSDLDVAVLGKKFIDFEKQLEIFGDLAKVFGDSRERELDVKTLHDADPLFLFEVVKDGRLVFGDASAYDNFVLYAYKNFHNSRNLFRLRDELIERRMLDLKKSYA